MSFERRRVSDGDEVYSIEKRPCEKQHAGGRQLGSQVPKTQVHFYTYKLDTRSIIGSFHLTIKPWSTSCLYRRISLVGVRRTVYYCTGVVGHKTTRGLDAHVLIQDFGMLIARKLSSHGDSAL